MVWHGVAWFAMVWHSVAWFGIVVLTREKCPVMTSILKVAKKLPLPPSLFQFRSRGRGGIKCLILWINWIRNFGGNLRICFRVIAEELVLKEGGGVRPQREAQ